MAHSSHKRETNARLFTRVPSAPAIAGPLAVIATASAVSLGVLTSGSGVTSAASLSDALPPAASGPTAGDSTPAALDLAALGLADDLERRSISRAGVRGAEAPRISSKPARLSKVERLMLPAKVREAVRGAETTMFTTEVLNLWTEPGAKARNTGELDASSKVLLTGRSLLGREEIVVGKSTRWVTSGYFSEEKPPEEPALGGDCTNGTSVASGVSPNIVKVHQAVCAAFPSITTYGTFRSDGEHAQGIAVDIMVSGEEGYRVADFVRANAAALGVSYAIYAQRIWSVERSGEGWRSMSDRGSATANHYDHVHVTTY